MSLALKSTTEKHAHCLVCPICTKLDITTVCPRPSLPACVHILQHANMLERVHWKMVVWSAFTPPFLDLVHTKQGRWAGLSSQHCGSRIHKCLVDLHISVVNGWDVSSETTILTAEELGLTIHPHLHEDCRNSPGTQGSSYKGTGIGGCHHAEPSLKRQLVSTFLCSPHSKNCITLYVYALKVSCS